MSWRFLCSRLSLGPAMISMMLRCKVRYLFYWSSTNIDRADTIRSSLGPALPVAMGKSAMSTSPTIDGSADFRWQIGVSFAHNSDGHLSCPHLCESWPSECCHSYSARQIVQPSQSGGGNSNDSLLCQRTFQVPTLLCIIHQDGDPPYEERLFRAIQPLGCIKERLTLVILLD